MPHPRFLLEQTLTGPGNYVLGRLESHHAASVLRLRRDDAVVVFDGHGNHAVGIILDANRDEVVVKVDGVHSEAHLPLHLTIATAIPKGKRWQMLVEKCTELGVDRIIPVLSTRSVVKGEGDIGKWRRWIIEAAKQSRRYHIPEIDEPMPLAQVASEARKEGALLLLTDPQGEGLGCYRGALEHVRHVIALIGPEGGFSPEEVRELVSQGAKGIRLSPFILRIETAAAAICALIRDNIL